MNLNADKFFFLFIEIHCIHLHAHRNDAATMLHNLCNEHSRAFNSALLTHYVKILALFFSAFGAYRCIDFMITCRVGRFGLVCNFRTNL